MKEANWEKYRKTAMQEMRPYVPGEELTGISVAEEDTPEFGGMIARGKDGEQWYISKKFFQHNYEPWTLLPMSEGDKFVKHIRTHLPKGEDVICKICGMTVEEIYVLDPY